MTDKLDERRALLMGFMDGELAPEEMAKVNDALMRDASLRDEYEALCRACGKLERVDFDMPGEAELKALWKSPFSTAATQFSWALIVGGGVVLLGFMLYAFFFLSNEEPVVTTAMAAMGIGFLVLLALKIRERVSTYAKDPYKDIEK